MEKRVDGIVRHYRVPDSDHLPYMGILHTEEDEEARLSLQSLLESFPDGEHITISIIGHGEHLKAKGYVLMWTKPHLYARVRKNERTMSSKDK